MVALNSLLLGALAGSAVYASPLSSSASCRTYKSQLSSLVNEIPQAQHFCGAYIASRQTTSPIKGISGASLRKACQCATSDPASARVMATVSRARSGQLAGAAAAAVCRNPQLAKILSGLKNVQFFCQTFDPTKWQHGSPLWGATTASVQQACQCVLNSASATTSTSSSSPPPPTSTPTPAPSPGFSLCPKNPSLVMIFKPLCNTPPGKAWACKCPIVAQVCFPNQQLAFCPKPTSSSTPTPPASTSTTASSTSTIITTSPSVSASPSTTSSSVPSTSTDATVSTTSSDAPLTTSTTTMTDAPVATSTTPDASVATTTTTDAPVVTTSTSTSDPAVTTSTAADAATETSSMSSAPPAPTE